MITTLADRAATCRAVLPATIVSRSFVTETVLLDVSSGRYFRLDAESGAMLDAALTSRSLSAAAASLTLPTWSPEEVVADLLRLCNELEALGLLRLEGVR